MKCTPEDVYKRQQEFGVLQSIGLSNKQLYKMLRMECLYYVFGTMAITFVFGTAAGYILCQIFNQVGVFGKLHYTFPFLQVLLFFAVLVVIALIYSTLAIRYCHKQSLVAVSYTHLDVYKRQDLFRQRLTR